MGDKEAEMNVKDLIGVLEELWPITGILKGKTPDDLWKIACSLEGEYPFSWGIGYGPENEVLGTYVFDGKKIIFVRIGERETEAMLYDREVGKVKIITYKEIK